MTFLTGTATTQLPCGGSATLKWNSKYTGGALTTLEVERALFSQRATRATWDSNNCLEGDAKSRKLTSITMNNP